MEAAQPKTAPVSRRRVLLVVDALEIGGVASHLTSSLGRISRSRYDLRVANLGPSTRLSEQLRALTVKVIDMNLTGPFAFVRRVLALRRLVRALGVELIHTYGHAGPVARLAAGKVPLVSTLPEPWSAAGLRGRLQIMLERRTASRAARLLVPSESMRRHFADGWGLRTEVVPNFLDVLWFRERIAQVSRPQERIRLGVGPDETLLLHMGRGGKGKGLEVLLEAFQMARIEHPRLRLFLTGEESRMMPARTQAEALGLGDSVVFLGLVDDVIPLYAAADLFMLPSTQDGWSMGLLEAMAAGLPAVATAAGGIPELAAETHALLVETQRPEALARGILKLASDPRLRADLGAQAAARAKELDVSVWAPRLEQLYADVIRSASAA
jgi:glycosyltransferase involved in cell wall biosynthesis